MFSPFHADGIFVGMTRRLFRNFLAWSHFRASASGTPSFSAMTIFRANSIFSFVILSAVISREMTVEDRRSYEKHEYIVALHALF